MRSVAAAVGQFWRSKTVALNNQYSTRYRIGLEKMCQSVADEADLSFFGRIFVQQFVSASFCQ